MSLEKIEALRTKLIPTWAQLRQLGNSRAVQASAIFPVVGYVILLNNGVKDFFDGGIAGGSYSGQNVWHDLWSAKLYFIYFGLLSIGVGSVIYQWRCPRLIKKYGDWEDYVRVDGPIIHPSMLQMIINILREHYKLKDNFDSHSAEFRKVGALNSHYSALSTDEWIARLIVAALFYGGFLLLAVPSLMTVIKIVGRLL